MAALALNGVAVGAPVIVLEDSLLLHLPSVHRLGRGSHHRPISSYERTGVLPVHWTTVCGQLGTVILNRGVLIEETLVCPRCFAVELS